MKTMDENACPNSIAGPASDPETGTQVLYSNPFMGQPNSSPDEEVPAADRPDWCSPSDIMFVAKLSASRETPVSVTACSSRSNPVSEKSEKRVALCESLFQPVARNCWQRPKCLTFTIMIAMAMTSRPDKQLPVPAIYRYIMQSFPYFRTASTKWRNSVRHNLSQTGVFRKSGSPRTQQKGYNWTLNEQKEQWLRDEIECKQIKDWRYLKHQIADPSVLMDMQAIGLLHPSLTHSLIRQ